MDSITIIILGILFIVLAWFAILIFSEKPNKEPESGANTEPDPGLPPLDSPLDEMGMYQQLMGEYANMLKKLRKKLRAMEEPDPSLRENPAVPDPEKPPWEKPVFPMPKAPSIPAPESPDRSIDTKTPMEASIDSLADMKIENSALHRKLRDYELRTQRLEEEVSILKDSLKHHEQNIQHYRGMIRGLQGNFTVINKYNYRLCVKNPGTGEWEYRLIKIPPDFDPFNPTNITSDGIEIFEDFSVEVPTRLGDIIRKEFTRGELDEYPPYWPTSPPSGKDEHIRWEVKGEKH